MWDSSDGTALRFDAPRRETTLKPEKTAPKQAYGLQCQQGWIARVRIVKTGEEGRLCEARDDRRPPGVEVRADNGMDFSLCLSRFGLKYEHAVIQILQSPDGTTDPHAPPVK